MTETPAQARTRREGVGRELHSLLLDCNGNPEDEAAHYIAEALEAEAQRYAPLVEAATNEIAATHGPISGPCRCPLCQAVANLKRGSK